MQTKMKNEEDGFFGEYGGAYSSETLMPILADLWGAFKKYSVDPAFMAEFHAIMDHWAGRPTPLYFAENLSKKYGAKIYLKREDLLHGGAHKTNNALGQALLAKRMGKTRIIAETGAGQHGVATAMACAKLGLPARIYMGAVDVARQAPNVERMRILGAEVVPVEGGSKTLKDAINEALRDWTASPENTHYILGSVTGPHPFPMIVKFFHTVIGKEARAQILELEGKLPDFAVACVGGGSNAIGLFSGFMEDESVKLVGAEPGGEGIDTGKHGATLTKGVVSYMHGMRTLGLQDAEGQIMRTTSISAGLDYPLVGPEHAYLRDVGRARYEVITNDEAVAAFQALSQTEGILPALESCHAVAQGLKLAEENAGAVIVVNLSGRGDKDMDHLQRYLAARK